MPCCQQIWLVFNCSNADQSSSVLLVETQDGFAFRRSRAWVFLSFNSIRGQARNMQGLCCIEDLWVRVRRCNFRWSLQIKLGCFTVRKCILIISYDFAASFIRLMCGFVFKCLPYEFSRPTCSEFMAARHPHLWMKRWGFQYHRIFSVIDLSPHIYKGQRSHTSNKIKIEIQPKIFTCLLQPSFFNMCPSGLTAVSRT